MTRRAVQEQESQSVKELIWEVSLMRIWTCLVCMGLLLFHTSVAVEAQKRLRPGPPMPPRIPLDPEVIHLLATDPRYSYVGALVQQENVAVELNLTDAQKTQLQSLKAAYQTFETHHLGVAGCELFVVDPEEQKLAVGPEKIMTRPDGATYHMRANFDSHKPPILVARDEPTAEVKAQIQQQIRQEDPSAKVLNLLSPAQQQRLRELDLQWRSPLAIEDQAVARQLGLTAEQRQKVAALTQSYRDEYWRSYREVTKRILAYPYMPGLQQLDAMMNEWRKHCVEQHKAAEAGILMALSADQNKQWQVLLGTPFTFFKPPSPPIK
jgi:Spy/CpxP family protein refolding chaperone